MSTYFRYLRPVQFDYQRGVLEVLPTGGICFQINDDEPIKLFSYSICHSEDVFSKQVARMISNSRMIKLMDGRSSKAITDLFDSGAFNPLSRHEDEIIKGVEGFIDASTEVVAYGEECFFFEDLLLLQEKINDIYATHTVAHAMLRAWQRNDNHDALRSFYADKIR